MVIDYGSGAIATSIENIIMFGKSAMKVVISNILLVVIIFVILNILYEMLVLIVDNEPSKILSKIMNELIFASFLVFIMTNWIGGIKSAWTIFVDWVIKSNLGFTIILILLKMFMYVVIILFFGDVLRLIVEVHLMYVFSGIAFILMVFKPLRENYGLAIPRTMLVTAIQYYVMFVVIGLITGFLNYVHTIGGKFLYIAAVFLITGLLKSILYSIRRMSVKL